MDINAFTLLSFKSYGPNWIDSRLRVDIQVVPRSGADERPGPMQLFVDGYHDRTISAPYPHRFRLTGTGARAGDTVLANFTLVNGITFKIVGVTFCQPAFADAEEDNEEYDSNTMVPQYQFVYGDSISISSKT
jgi:hypothetical protein